MTLLTVLRRMQHISFSVVKYMHRVPYQDLQHSKLPGTFHLNRGSDLRYTYNVIPSVQTKVVFSFERDIGISYVRLLLHNTMLEDDSTELVPPQVLQVNVVRTEKLQNISLSIVQDICRSERTLLKLHVI